MNTSSTKTISVVIPCYNYAKYLKECIESVKNQTYPIHEIIVVNDGGSDNPLEIAMECEVIFIDKPNGGLSSARNAGIRVATGEYIMCLDADDKLVPGAIEEHMNLIENDLTIAQCGLMEFGERHVIMTPTHPTGLPRILNGNTIYCNAVFSKRVWEAVGGYDESEIMRLGWEDYEFWIRCLSYGCHVNTSDFIALRYRVHDNNMTKMTTHPNWEKLSKYIHDKHIDIYEKYNII